jgi:hypothetical protein
VGTQRGASHLSTFIPWFPQAPTPPPPLSSPAHSSPRSLTPAETGFWSRGVRNRARGGGRSFRCTRRRHTRAPLRHHPGPSCTHTHTHTRHPHTHPNAPPPHTHTPDTHTPNTHLRNTHTQHTHQAHTQHTSNEEMRGGGVGGTQHNCEENTQVQGVDADATRHPPPDTQVRTHASFSWRAHKLGSKCSAKHQTF